MPHWYPAPKQRNSRKENKLLRQKAIPFRLKASQNVGRKIVMLAGPKSMEKTTMATSFQSNIDKKYKVIRKIETDTDSRARQPAFRKRISIPVNTSKEVYADRGYPSKGRSAQLKENGYRNQIQRKGSSKHATFRMSAATQSSNSQNQGTVEYVFGAH